ncbi:DUF5063 domain-containing protein [Sunxiuqinia sp. A32]|uniref:DUF5063 domain-containing protein n=1 Tax=Sunxiuqinia sp. A32 TaxID=3461496 RepID=UPI0040463089
MEEEQINPIVFSKNTIEFVTVANEFCRFVETAGGEATRDFLAKTQKILPLLYLKTSVLPEFDSEEEMTLEKYVSEVDYNFLQEKIRNLLGEHDDYKEVFDQGMQFSEQPLTESISEGLADIYQDLKDFIMSYQIGNELIMQEALWECINNFKSFWGQKLVNCLRAVHSLVFSDIDFEDQVNLEDIKDDEIQSNKPDWLTHLFNNEDD